MASSVSPMAVSMTPIIKLTIWAYRHLRCLIHVSHWVIKRGARQSSGLEERCAETTAIYLMGDVCSIQMKSSRDETDLVA